MKRGQSLVELAISFVFLIFLLSGAIEFSIAFFQYVQLRDAAQEGALFGAINPTDLTGIENRVRCSSLDEDGACGGAPIDLTSQDVVIKITYSGEPCEGSGIRVDVSYTHKVFMPFFSAFVKQINLNAYVTDTILTPVCP